MARQMHFRYAQATDLSVQAIHAVATVYGEAGWRLHTVVPGLAVSDKLATVTLVFEGEQNTPYPKRADVLGATTVREAR